MPLTVFTALWLLKLGLIAWIIAVAARIGMRGDIPSHALRNATLRLSARFDRLNLAVAGLCLALLVSPVPALEHRLAARRTSAMLSHAPNDLSALLTLEIMLALGMIALNRNVTWHYREDPGARRSEGGMTNAMRLGRYHGGTMGCWLMFGGLSAWAALTLLTAL